MPYPSAILAFGSLEEINANTTVIGAPVWSQGFSAAGASAAAATAVEPGEVPAFLVQGFVDGYVSIGISPNATVEPRIAVRAGEDKVFPCRPGQKIAWAPA